MFFSYSRYVLVTVVWTQNWEMKMSWIWIKATFFPPSTSQEKWSKESKWFLCNLYYVQYIYPNTRLSGKDRRQKPQGIASSHSSEIKSWHSKHHNGKNVVKNTGGEKHKSIWEPAGCFMSKRCKLGLILSLFINQQKKKKHHLRQQAAVPSEEGEQYTLTC